MPASVRADGVLAERALRAVSALSADWDARAVGMGACLPVGKKGCRAMTVYVVMELAPTGYPFVAAVCAEREMADSFAFGRYADRWVEPVELTRGWKIDQRQVVAS